MDIDTAFMISGIMCIPFLTFVLYFFDDKKHKDEGWKGFFKWLLSGRFLNIFFRDSKPGSDESGVKLSLFLVILSLLCGCANIHGRIIDQSGGHREPYECTENAIVFCTFITVPQVVGPEKFEWRALNLITVPIGVCCFIVDIPLEVVCDTICYPYDKYWSIKPEKEVNPLAE